MTLMEVNAASEAVASIASPDANVIFGAVVDEKYEGQINVTIIATGTEGGIHASDGTQMDTVHENILSAWKATSFIVSFPDVLTFFITFVANHTHRTTGFQEVANVGSAQQRTSSFF